MSMTIFADFCKRPPLPPIVSRTRLSTALVCPCGAKHGHGIPIAVIWHR